MLTQAIRTRIFKEGEALLPFLRATLPKIPERAIIVVTSKIVALAERRTTVANDEKTKERLIRAESDLAIRTKYVWLTVKDGMVMASAGIDESNADGKLILLPKDSFKTARRLRRELRRIYNLRELGVLITDSRTVPLRSGVTGVALGYAGFSGVRDYRDKPDIFGRKFRFSQTDVADSLATAAVLVMGEGAEQQPLALIEDAPVTFIERVRRNELAINPKEDMYRPFFTKLSRK